MKLPTEIIEGSIRPGRVEPGDVLADIQILSPGPHQFQQGILEQVAASSGTRLALLAALRNSSMRAKIPVKAPVWTGRSGEEPRADAAAMDLL